MLTREQPAPPGAYAGRSEVPRWPNQTCPTGFVGRQTKEYRERTPAAASVLPELLRIRRLTVWGSGGIRPGWCAHPLPRAPIHKERSTPSETDGRRKGPDAASGPFAIRAVRDPPITDSCVSIPRPAQR